MDLTNRETDELLLGSRIILKMLECANVTNRDILVHLRFGCRVSGSKQENRIRDCSLKQVKPLAKERTYM